MEIVYSGAGEDSPPQALESDAVLEERVAEMKEEFGKCVAPSATVPEAASIVPAPVMKTRSVDLPSVSCCVMDPRLSRDHHHQLFSNSDLVGTVEKTLSIFGFEDRKPEPITPAKRKVIVGYYSIVKFNTNSFILVVYFGISPKEEIK